MYNHRKPFFLRSLAVVISVWQLGTCTSVAKFRIFAQNSSDELVHVVQANMSVSIHLLQLILKLPLNTNFFTTYVYYSGYVICYQHMVYPRNLQWSASIASGSDQFGVYMYLSRNNKKASHCTILSLTLVCVLQTSVSFSSFYLQLTTIN